MGRIEQYHAYWVTLDPVQGSEIAKTRPCIVASPNELNYYLSTVIIIPVTSTLHDYPFRMQCKLMGKQGELAVDQIRTVDKTRLDTSKPLGQLPADKIIALQNLLNEMFCR